MFSGSDELEHLLTQPETTVEEVLNYVHFTDELSTRNPALLEFLALPDRVRDLVELVRRGPNLSYPAERQYQLAYLATEALTSENWTIQDALLQNEEALDGLYSILQTKDPASLPPLTASFLHRILVYLSKWAALELLSFLKSKTDFVDCVIRHMDKAAVPEILYHLLNTANYNTFLSICQWLDEAQLVQKLLDRFLCDNLEIRAYACQFYCGLIYVCRNHRYRFLRPISDDGQTNLLLSRLESQETFGRIISAAFLDEAHLGENRQFIPMALCLLRNILIPSTQPETCVQLPELPVEGRETELEPSSIHLIGRLSPHLSSLKALLLAPPQNSSERNSPSSTSPSLGSLRIHIIRFLCYLLESGSPSVTKEFAHLGLLGVIMELFFEHKWHTFLHASFEYLVRLIVNRASTLTTDDYSRSDFHNAASNGPSDDCRSQSPEPRRKASNYPTPSSENSNDSLCNGHSDVESPMEAGAILCEPFPRLLHQLLVEYQFLDRLMKAWDENENSGGKPMVRRAGYMGHLRSMANSLNDFLPSSVLVQPKNGTTGATGGAAVSQTAATPLTNGECVPDCAQFTPPPPCSIDAADRSNSETQLGELFCAMIPIEVRMRWGNFVQGDLARSNNAAFINYANFPNSSSSSSVSTDDEVSRYKISDEAISAALQNAYQHYCSNQSLSASFPDFFGYAEDEFDDSRERLDVVVEQALSGLNFNLSIQEDTTNNALFEQACNELVITEDGDEVGDEAAGLPIVCMESNSPSQLCSSVRPTAEASVSPNVDGDRRRIEETGTSPILCRQPGDHHSLTQGVSAAVEKSQVPADGHLKGLSLTYLKEVFCSLTTSNEQQQENLSASTVQEDDPDRSYGHLREASRRGDEALPDLASTTVASVTDVSPPRLLLTGRTPNHELQHADRHTPPLLSSPPLSPSPVRDLHPRLALAPGPTPSNGQPIMSVARSRRLSASPTADYPPWVDVVDDLGSPVMRGSLNSVLSANGASAAPLGDPTADSVLPRRYTSQKYTWSASSSVPGPSSFTASMRETQTELQDVVSSELPDANSFVLPRVALLTTDVSSDSSAASSSSSLNPAISVTREKLDSVGSPASVAVYSSTADPVSASAATSAMFVTYDQAPVFSLPAFSIPRPIQPTVRSHRLTRLSLPNGQKAVEAAAAEAALETPNSASPTSYRAAINTPEIVMQILNGTVPDSASIGRRLPASGPAPSVFEDRSRVKRLVGQLTEDEEEEEGRFSPRRSWGGRHTLPPVFNGSMVPLESPQCVLLSRRPPPFVISESELDEEEDDDDEEEEEEEDVDGDGYPAEEQLLPQNRFRTHTTLNLKKTARDVESS